MYLSRHAPISLLVATFLGTTTILSLPIDYRASYRQSSPQQYLSHTPSDSSIASDKSHKSIKNGLKHSVSNIIPKPFSSNTKTSLRCKHYPSTLPAPLASLASALESVLGDYNDQLLLPASSSSSTKTTKSRWSFGKSCSRSKSPSPSPDTSGAEESTQITMEKCLAGYDDPSSSTLSTHTASTATTIDKVEDALLKPAVFFSQMSKRQAELVKTIVENQILRRFPHFKVVEGAKAGNANADVLALVMG